MRNKVTYLLLVLQWLQVSGQELSLPLSKAGALSYRNNMYVYGFRQDSKLAVYRLNGELGIADSSIIQTGGHGAAQLQPMGDTLHGYLNLYVFAGEKQMVDVWRLDRDLKPLHEIKGIDAGRLNNRQVTGENCYELGDLYYAVKTVADSSGKQFYLNKYKLQDPALNFEYKQLWQFPFERRNIISAGILYADKKLVLLFVNVSGDKKGQWLLRIDAGKGELLKALKLNKKGEGEQYHVTLATSLGEGRLLLAGVKSPEGKLSGQKVFVCELDSFGNETERKDFVASVKAGSAKEIFVVNPYALEIKNAQTVLYYDVLKHKAEGCYQLVNNSRAILQRNEENELVLRNLDAGANVMLEQFSAPLNKKDKRGMLCVGPQAGVLDMEPVLNELLLLSDRDEAGNQKWLLKKTEGTKQLSISAIAPDKAVYREKILMKIPLSEYPVIYRNEKKCLLGRQVAESRYVLAGINW